jgi:major vault protein
MQWLPVEDKPEEPLMEENRRPRERELVLAPNEYAYVLDTTKGHINCYVGPNKTSLAQTDDLVVFDDDSKRFRSVDMSEAVQLFATAPANWYVSLKNPAREGQHPSSATNNSLVELNIGEKVNIPGPVSFPLWPGQMIKVISGHRLKANQYLVARVYDAEEAQRSWREALGLPHETPDEEEPTFIAGERLVIRGTSASFYIPPTGVEVLTDERGRYVRDAVALARLEYCVLVSDDGSRAFVRGEAVVFPRADQRFWTRNDRRRFRAVELSDTTGLYVKVISPYVDDDGSEHREGEELFLTGTGRIYFPRAEHAIIRYGKHELHHAIAIPRGEGRYVLDRESGEVSLVRGPRMYLPDPRREVITRRVLADRECTLLFPNNAEALDVNRQLRGVAPAKKPAPLVVDTETGRTFAAPDDDNAAFSRPDAFVAPRTITLDNKYEGAVTVDVWSGYAVQVVDKSGGRRVVRGPETVLLAYDETLEALSLSAGTPKSDDRRLRTAFLRLAGNKVSDCVEVTTADLVKAQVWVKYRVNFEGDDASAWFRVDNYVQLLCDHASSLIKARARRITIRELRATVTELVRDVVLGDKPEDGARRGLAFDENGMRVYDVEVLDLDVVDDEVENLLQGAQEAAIRQEISVAEKATAVANEHRLQQLERQLARERHETDLLALELQSLRDERQHDVEESRRKRQGALLQLEREQDLRDAEMRDEVRRKELETNGAEHAMELRRKGDLQELALKVHDARVAGTVRQAEAFSPHLIDALRRLGDEQLIAALSENFGELAAVEGRGVLETAKKFLDFVPASMVPTLRNGEALHSVDDE